MSADVSVPVANEGVSGCRGEGVNESASPSHSQTPDFLLDVRITVSVEVGRAQMAVRQVMELGPGSIVELQRGASEPVEIFANGRCIGRGEIVVVGEQFGVRITELAKGSSP
jgi:flagellar motor switch protein FliN